MNVISAPTRLLLSLSMLKGVGPAALKKASSVRGFVDKTIDELASDVPQISRSLASGSDWKSAQEAAARQIDDAEKQHARILSPLDSEYPQLLAATKDDPFILYVQGSLASSPAQSVAVIGTREPTIHGRVIAERITQFFAEHHWSIVSGLAIGCDGIAHQAALDIGAHTVAVLAHGLHMIAPTKHKKLAQEILSSGGALVSEYPFGQNVQSQQYVKRDRTQAGMAQGVVMIQSDVKGGSLYASRASLDYGRWLAVPYPTERDRENDEPKVQANLLIAEGADAERADLLRCSSSALSRVMILRSREDYLRMIEPTGSKASDLLSASDSHKPVTLELPYNENINQQEGEASVTWSADESSPVESAPTDTPAVKGTVTVPPVVEYAKEVADIPSTSRLDETISDMVIRCHVALDRVPFISLDISRVPQQNLSRPNEGPAVGRSDDIPAALSARLRYVQTRLDAINQIRHADVQKSEEGALLLRFSVEDALWQMKRAVDILNVLKRDSITSYAARTLDEHSIEHVSGEQLSLPVHAQGESHKELPLSEILNVVLASIPRSIVVDVERNMSFGSGSEKSFCAMDIDFDYLVRLLNELITTTRYNNALHVLP
jgi:DNA processing protein